MSASTAASRGGHLSKEAKRASATSLFAQLSDLNSSSGKVEMDNNVPAETRNSTVSFELAPLSVPSPVAVPELCRNTLTAKSSTESAWGLIGGQIRGTQLQDPAENTPLESLDGHIPSVNTKTQSQQQHHLTQPPPPLSSPQQCSQPLPPPPPPPQQLAPKNVRTNTKRRASSTTTSAAVNIGNPENTSPRSPHFSPSMKSYFDDSDDTGDEAMTEAMSLSHFMRRYTKGVRPHPATMANTSTTTAATTGNKRFSRDRPHSSRQSFLSGDMNGRGDCGVREAKRMRSDSALGARRAFASASMTDLSQSGSVGVGNVAPTPPLVTGRRRRTRWTHLDHVPPVPPLPARTAGALRRLPRAAGSSARLHRSPVDGLTMAPVYRHSESTEQTTTQKDSPPTRISGVDILPHRPSTSPRVRKSPRPPGGSSTRSCRSSSEETQHAVLGLPHGSTPYGGVETSLGSWRATIHDSCRALRFL